MRTFIQGMRCCSTICNAGSELYSHREKCCQQSPGGRCSHLVVCGVGYKIHLLLVYGMNIMALRRPLQHLLDLFTVDVFNGNLFSVLLNALSTFRHIYYTTCYLWTSWGHETSMNIKWKAKMGYKHARNIDRWQTDRHANRQTNRQTGLSGR